MQTSSLFAAALLLAACAEDPVGPEAPGRLVISTLTQGNDPDVDGYELTVDGNHEVSMPSTGAHTLVLAAGTHTVVLAGVAGNCGVNPGTSVVAEVVSGRTRTLAFEIDCPLTGLRVRVVTSGEFLDPNGYRLAIDGTDYGFIDTGGDVLLRRLAPGNHAVSLRGVEANCTPAETTRTVTVVIDQVAVVEFGVSCVTPMGTVRISAPTTGPTPGPYEVRLWYQDYWYYGWYYGATYLDLGNVAPGGVMTAQAYGGEYWAELVIPFNCSVDRPNPTSPFTLGHGSVVEIVFPVTCSDDPWGY